MKRFLAIAAAVLLTAACAPQTTNTNTATSTPVQSAEASACAARNGTMRQVGKLQSWQCVINFTDAGKICTDSSQCQGSCLGGAATDMTPGTATTGVCQANSNRFGCTTPVENGKAGHTLCID